MQAVIGEGSDSVTRSASKGLSSLAHAIRGALAVGILLSIAVGVFVFVRGDTALQSGAQGDWLLAAVVFTAVSLIVHECAHACIAAALGFRVVEIRIGTGPKLLRHQFGSTRIDLRLIPGFGYVQPIPRSHGQLRLRWLAVFAAGPTGTLLTAIAFIVIAPDPWKFAALVVGAPELIGSLVPRDYERDGRRMRTDGGRILDLLRNWQYNS